MGASAGRTRHVQGTFRQHPANFSMGLERQTSEDTECRCSRQVRELSMSYAQQGKHRSQ